MPLSFSSIVVQVNVNLTTYCFCAVKLLSCGCKDGVSERLRILMRMRTFYVRRTWEYTIEVCVARAWLERFC
jgi:hypothetical protein